MDWSNISEVSFWKSKKEQSNYLKQVHVYKELYS